MEMVVKKSKALLLLKGLTFLALVWGATLLASSQTARFAQSVAPSADRDWHIERVGGPYAMSDRSLRLDADGYPHIAHGTDDLYYAYYDGTTWHRETVDNIGDIDRYASLALDSVGHPHISYHDWGNGDLKYAWHDGSNWQIETVDSEGDVGEYTSLALDAVNRPHISYYDCTNGDLKYAWHDGSSWQIETVDGEGHVGSHTSLALDETSQPHISYYGGTNGDLKYARLMFPSLSLYKRAVPSDNVRNNEALTYTLTLSGPGLSVRLWDPLPPNARYVSGSLTGTVAPPAVYSPTVKAVIWQGVLPTDSAQLVSFKVTPGITGTAVLSLSLPIVNTAWLFDIGSNRSAVATAIVNSWRAYLPLMTRDG
jgi:hypothetical protein